VGIGRAGRHATGIGRKAESKQQVRHIGQKRVAYTLDLHFEVYDDTVGWMVQ
jgi:hypothetical protein